MKRLSLLLAMVVMIGISAFGQQPDSHPRGNFPIQKISGQAKDIKFGLDRPTIDTFGNLQPCDSLFFLWTLGAGIGTGFLSGHNPFIDSAKAERYIGLPGDQINGLWMFFAFASSNATSQKIHVKVWDDNGAGSTPGTELGNVDVTQASIKTDVDNGDLTTVTFPTPITMPGGGNFYAGFRMDYKKKQGVLTFDTLRSVALANPDFFSDCSDEADENSAYEQWHFSPTDPVGFDGAWHSYFDVYGLSNRNPVFAIVQSADACVVTITPTSATICKGKSTSLTASVTGGGGTWTWAPATGLNVTTGATVTAKSTSTTTYTATNSQGCSSTVTVTVNPKPSTVISQGACSGGAILLNANANPNTGVKYTWYKNGTKISGATQSTFSATTSGQYKVKVKITATACSKTSKEVTVTITCKMGDNNLAAFEATAYPNPFTKSVSVNIASGSPDAATVSLMDFSGRTLRTFVNVDATAPFEINESLAPGVYFVKVAQGMNEKMIKVVKSE